MALKRIQAGPRMTQAIVHGKTVYLAGQVAFDAPGGSVADQTRNILDRIDALLEEAGSDRSKLLAVTIWLADMTDFNEMNAVWDAWVTPGEAPCRACVESARLASADYAVEIQGTAAI